MENPDIAELVDRCQPNSMIDARRIVEGAGYRRWQWRPDFEYVVVEWPSRTPRLPISKGKSIFFSRKFEPADVPLRHTV